MTILQQHIDFNIGMQKIASNVNRNFQPEEIDWLLNRTINRFVQDIIRSNKQTGDSFQSDEIDLDSIRTLVVSDYPLDVYKTNSSGNTISSELPPDYSFRVGIKAGIIRSCVENYSERSQFSSGSSFERTYVIKVVPSIKDSIPFYETVKLVAGLVEIVPESAFPNSLPDRDMIFTIIDIIRDYTRNSPNAKIYWEYYKDKYYPNSLIIIPAFTYNQSPQLTIDQSTINSITIDNSRLLPVGTADSFHDLRIVRSSQKAKLQNSAFAKSQWKSPIGSINTNTIKVYHDEKFIVTKLLLDYVRKPRIVSLSLNQNCDLPEEFHEKITQLAVEYAKQAIMDPNYQWKLQDNQLRNKI